MTFRRLALNNVRGSWQRYLAYFLSCAFSVASFYSFLSFRLLPEVRTGHIVNEGRYALNALLPLAVAVIVVFSALFILYSTAAFIRARKKEFGLLTLMGMTQGEIRLTVFYELGVIAVTALTAGLAAGILLSKLFFMAIAAVLESGAPVAFAVPALAVGITALVFGAIFIFANGVSLIGVRASSIRELLKAHHTAKLGPRKNVFLFLLGVALTGTGYWLAWVTGSHAFTARSLPIIALTVAGTYFLVTQGAVFVCDWLRRLTGYYRRGTNLLVINRLVFRLTDNARAIFISAVLIAVVGSALGAIDTLIQSNRLEALSAVPYALTIYTPDATADAGAIAERVTAALQQQGIKDARTQIVSSVDGQLALPDQPPPVAIASLSSFNQWAAISPLVKPAALPPGKAILVVDGHPKRPLVGETAEITVGAERLSVTISGVIVRSWLPAATSVVLSDADYAGMAAGSAEKVSLIGFEYKNWLRYPGVGDAVAPILDGSAGVVERASAYQAGRQSASLTLFIGTFIATLFFIAAGSLVYFKLFTEIAEDRAQYSVLKDIGVTGREVSRLVGGELAALFFVPLVIGIVHTAFALKTLSNLLTISLSVVGPGLTVAGIYLIAQTLYYLATKRAYQREVLS